MDYREPSKEELEAAAEWIKQSAGRVFWERLETLQNQDCKKAALEQPFSGEEFAMFQYRKMFYGARASAAEQVFAVRDEILDVDSQK